MTWLKTSCRGLDSLRKLSEHTMEDPITSPAGINGTLDRAAALLRVMGNVDRLQLLAALQREELCVGQLAERLDIQQPTLSQQLTVLRQHELVETRRMGKHVFYRLAPAFAPQLSLVLQWAGA
ncbi:ArsR/SmtB family transcription factor [Roseateles sp. BYS78W]|uniref:ArsR/SmtB family transcription factor n=1 Tax=Pelomonas candidula TaxID=3299025 RepID=A0ABW7HCX4_9BURK